MAVLLRRLRKGFRDILFLYKHSQKVPIGVLDKLKMWKNGFLSESHLTYALEHNDYRDYLSDHARLKQVTRINGYYAVMLYDKLYFALLLRDFEEHVVKTYALIKDRQVTFFGTAENEHLEGILRLCKEKGAVVLKPLVGTQGTGVIMISMEKNKIIMNGKEVSSEELLSAVKDIDDYLATGYVRQHEYASRIFPRTTNTIRIMTLWDDESNQPFVAAAAHRFGNSLTFPVDSWSKGGISAPIDLNTGTMGKAAKKPQSGKPHFMERHPETGSQIEGITVPHWDTIKAKTLEMAATLPFIPYIGWDIIVESKGFKVIEGNNCPDIKLFQIHAPLLKDQRIRRFYQRRIAQVNAGEHRGREYKLPFKV